MLAKPPHGDESVSSAGEQLAEGNGLSGGTRSRCDRRREISRGLSSQILEMWRNILSILNRYRKLQVAGKANYFGIPNEARDYFLLDARPLS